MFSWFGSAFGWRNPNPTEWYDEVPNSVETVVKKAVTEMELDPFPQDSLRLVTYNFYEAIKLVLEEIQQELADGGRGRQHKPSHARVHVLGVTRNAVTYLLVNLTSTTDPCDYVDDLLVILHKLILSQDKVIRSQQQVTLLQQQLMEAEEEASLAEEEFSVMVAALRLGPSA